jgi:hypothetical protein
MGNVNEAGGERRRVSFERLTRSTGWERVAEALAPALFRYAEPVAATPDLQHGNARTFLVVDS